MSLLFVDGFDHYATAGLAVKGWTVLGSTTITASNPRTGAGALKLGPGTSTTDGIKRGVAAADEHATFIAGCAYRPDDLAIERPLIFFASDSGATIHVIISVTTTGAVQARRGTIAGTVLGTSSAGLVTAGAYAHIEALVTLSDTLGVVTVRVNNASALSLTLQDTKNAGTKTVFDSIGLGEPLTASGNVSDGTVDDFYLCNGAGSAPSNTLLGDSSVRTLLPSGNGNSSQLTGSDGNSTDNYLLVDEASLDTADYVGSATDNQKDTYAMGNLSVVTGTVLGVQFTEHLSKTDTGARTGALVTRSGGTDYDSSDLALSTSGAYVMQVRETDPATSAAWTISAVNAVEVGVKVRP